MEIKKVPLNSVVVDHSVQRGFDQKWADWLFDNWDENQAQVPVVSARDNGSFHCTRGQHTVSVRRRQGHTEITSIVLYGLTHEQEAESFLGDTKRKAVSPADRFRVAAEAAHEPELSLRKLLAAHGLDGTFNAFARLRSIAVKTGGLTAADDVLFVATQAWGRQAAAVHGNIVAGLGTLFLRRTPDRQRLVDELRKVTPEVFRAHADQIYKNTSPPVNASVAHAEQALRLYNRGLRSDGPNKLATFIK